MERKKVQVADTGRWVGESHPKAKLTDEQVEWLRDLYEEGMVGYGTLCRAAEWMWGVKVAKNTMADICRYNRRVVTPSHVKTVRMTAE